MNSNKKLSEELIDLTERFDQNLRIIQSLLEFTNGESTLKERFKDLLTPEEAIQERYKLIKENFRINTRRMEIFEKIKKLNLELSDELDSDGIKKNSKIIIEEKNFLNEWKFTYRLKDDPLMLEIIEKLMH